MEKEENCQPTNSGGNIINNNQQMVDYMLNDHHTSPTQQQQQQNSLGLIYSHGNLSFADVMQFSDFGPKLGLNESKVSEEETGIDPVYFVKFPVLNEKMQEEDEKEEEKVKEEHNMIGKSNNKRKRPRIKSSEEVESQRMTHIAVERNRRKQMNEHLRVLRSLMPGSYVQRGDQASIIGGAIEFVRELEQLLQCLESQKRRRLYGDSSSSMDIQNPNPQPTFLPSMASDIPNEYIEAGVVQEDTAESKSCLADVEVKIVGFDAMIKILSRRRPGQLIKTIAALEDLQLNILHTNITTIEQTVLYSFNVKISGETGYTADDIANSIQQIFSFIHANSSI